LTLTLLGLALGALAGMVVATIVDATFLAHDTTVVYPQARLTPLVSLARSGGATLGVAATF
jgi:hypothetical protein